MPSLNIKRQGFVTDQDIYELNKIKDKYFPKIDYQYIREALQCKKPAVKDFEVTE